MGIHKPAWVSLSAFLGSVQPDDPVFCVEPEKLHQVAQNFLKGFPGLVSYAVKANPQQFVLQNLLSAGITAFDVASPAEFRQLRDLAPDAQLHYNNPVRTQREISESLECGITSFSIDRLGELEKLAYVAQHREIEVSIRLTLPIEGAAYNFGEKFGVGPHEAIGLLQETRRLGFSPSMTFHPGTQCKSPEAWASYIKACAEISKSSGVCLNRLNVGGGFPSHRQASAPDLEPIFAAIGTATTQAFDGQEPALVCEPGRAMVADAISLVTRVKAIGPSGEVFLNDGIYGGLAELPTIEQTDRIEAFDSKGHKITGPGRPCTVFGPTCDSLDVLPGQPILPCALREDDFVVLHGAGAYGSALATGFNGYGQHKTATIMRLHDTADLPGI